jgi:hypothetical protein
LAEPAAEFGGVELDVFAQHIEQRRIRIGIHLMSRPLTFNVIMAFLAAEDRRVRYAARALSGEMPSARGAHLERSFQRQTMAAGC